MAKVRSPNYPAISLPKAIELAAKVYKREHTHKCPAEVVANALGYSGLNGASLTTISALKKYGLLDEVGKDLKISTDALTILVDPPDSKERNEALRKAAFLPTLFAEFQRQYGDTLPSDENLRSFLIKRGFSPNTVDGPIRAYRETIALVTDLPPSYNADKGHLEGDVGDKPPPEVGDLVQWEASGVLRMEAPRKVRAIREHDGAKWVFVEGSETGIPMEEILVEKRAEPPPSRGAPPMLPEQQTFSFAQQEKEWLRGPLSKAASYRLIVTGEIGPKEIGNLISVLEAQKLVLSDDDQLTP